MEDSQLKANAQRMKSRGKKSANAANLPKQVMAALQGEIEPVEISLMYRFGLFLVSIVMVVLPLIYVGLIGVVVYGLFYHVTEHTSLIGNAGKHRSGAAFVFSLVLYLVPIIIGAIYILFMIKPLFAQSTQSEQRRSLVRKNEPLLFQFVERICDIVGAEHPERIDLDCQVNASASFSRGIFSFLNNDLVLTIGMPLVAGLSARQFAGVLAHEFGHFAQDAGMRLTYLIRHISHWFTRVVYERDSWDDTLVEWSERLDFRLSWVLYLARLLIWLNRQVLWVLMYVGHGVAGFMLRQMEFDADRYEVNLAGSKAFEATARKLQLLMYAHHGAMADLGDFYAEGRLADDLPRLILVNIADMPKEFKTEVNKSINESTTGWFDTHPADSKRIESAHAENEQGIFRLKAPASVLFSNFQRESKRVTSDFYRLIFGRKMKKNELHPVKELLVRQEAEKECFKALNRFYQGTYSPLRPLILTSLSIQAPQDAKVCSRKLKTARKKIVDGMTGYNNMFKQYDKLDTHEIEIIQAKAILRAKFKIDEDFFDQKLTNKTEVDRASTKLKRKQYELHDMMEPYETAASLRLECALQLLKVPKVRERIENVEDWEVECNRLFNALHEVNAQTPAITELRNERASLLLLLHNLDGHEEEESLIKTIRQRMRNLCRGMKQIRSTLKSLLYPFDHVKVDISVGEFALNELPDEDHPGEIIDALDAFAGNLLKLNARLIGRLCILAEEVELLLGLERLPEIEDKEDEEEIYELSDDDFADD